jgi:hypothetical protein
MNHIQCAKAHRVNNDEPKHREHNVPQPRFFRRESVGDAGHQNSNHRNQWRGDAQPFFASNPFAAHHVWPDTENREHNRQVHPGRSQRREPCQNSNEEWSLGFCHKDN